MDAIGTPYGFLSVLAVAVGVVVLAVAVVRMLIKGNATADLRGNKFALGQDKANDALVEIKAMVCQLRDELKAELLGLQLDLWEQQIRDSSIHIVQRAEIFGKYEARGGRSRDLLVYFDAAVKPVLEKYYREQSFVAG
jgi:hypothetical protein